MRNFAFLLAVTSLVACSANGSSDAQSGGSGGGDGGAAGSSGAGGSLLDASASDGQDEPPAAVATLHGKVLAPEGTIPISGALVYLTTTDPPPIPNGVYCDECVKISSSTPYTFSAADGTFALGAYATGSFKLVVQKGQFRRVRAIDVAAGDVQVPAASTTLPNHTDAASGDTIPHMAIVNEAWDSIDVALARLGLGTLVTNGFGQTQVDRATAPYDFYDGPVGWNGSKGTYQAILNDPNVLGQYHIVFLPCSWSNQTDCNTAQPSGDAPVQQNLRTFVGAGGKLYVTDYSYEFVRQVFPGYVTWQNETSTLGSACLPGAWDAPASSPDPGLTAWLAAQGITSFDIEQSWTALDAVHPGQTTDPKGQPITVTPKVWVEANTPSWGKRPATISFEQACGRVLYSTYHTEGTTNGLLPQERALLYVLLEVGVCVAPPDIH